MKNLIIVIHILLTVLLVGCADKGVYVGEEKDDKRHGQGTLTFSDGSKYKVEWKNVKYDGQGTMTLSDGQIFVGEFKEGEKWNVTLTDKEGKVIGKWVNGVKQ